MADGKASKALRTAFVSGWRNPRAAVFCPRHEHPCIEIVYHPTGRGSTRMDDGSRLDFTADSAVIYPPACPHTQETVADTVDVVVQVEAETLPAALDRAVLVTSIAEPAVHVDLGFLSAPMPRRTPLQQAALDCRAGALLCTLLDMIEAGDAPAELSAPERYAHAASRYIRAHYASLQSLADVADAVGISYDYLRHVFREHYGLSLQAWLTRTRLERARELLRHSSLPLKAIAPLCGFGTDRHLCAVFKAHAGVSPGQYRASAQVSQSDSRQACQ